MKNSKLLEIAASFTGHDWNAYRDLMWHWKRAADISITNQANGTKPLPFAEIWAIVKQHFGG